MNRLLIFHKTIARFRAGCFNDLSSVFDIDIVLEYQKHIKDNYEVLILNSLHKRNTIPMILEKTNITK